MAAPKQLKIVYPGSRGAAQNYECRDCPARCCKGWGIALSHDEAERIARDPDAVARLSGSAPHILAQGQLPMRERGGELVCVFLDADELCSLHKKHGHDFLPAACQAYPFGVAQDERGAQLALVSRYCPSIVENYGRPIEQVVKNKLKQLDPPAALSERMGLRSGRALARAHYIKLVEQWRVELTHATNIAETLVRLFDLTEAVDAALPRAHHPSDTEFNTALKAGIESPVAFLSSRQLGFSGRILIAHLLGALCYPARVMTTFRDRKPSWSEHLHSWLLRLKWLFRFGRVRLVHIADAVPIAAVDRVAPVLAGEHAGLVADYLREVLARRQGMQKKTYLHRFLIELALMSVVIARYARARAAARSERTVNESDVVAGIGIAELVLSHQGHMGQSLVLDQLRLKLMSNPDDFRALLSAEV